MGEEEVKVQRSKTRERGATFERGWCLKAMLGVFNPAHNQKLFISIVRYIEHYLNLPCKKYNKSQNKITNTTPICPNLDLLHALHQSLPSSRPMFIAQAS